MSLQPPSYFQAPPPTFQPKAEGELQTLHPSSKEDELASLKRENLALKQQLHAAAGNLPHSLTSPAPTASTVLAPQSAILTNDLLQVEAHLQSRVRLMEAERKEILVQMEKVKHSLSENEKRHEFEVAEIRQSHQSAIAKVQLDRDRLKEEFHFFKHEKEKRLNDLEGELVSQQQQYASEVDTLNSEKVVLETSNTALMSRIEQENHAHQEAFTHLQEQLASNVSEKHTLMEEMERQIKQTKRDLVAQVQHVVELESYLGGEIPGLGGNGDSEGGTRLGMTWKEERESLCNTVREQEHNLERLQSESKLLHIRLASLSEILSIQETDIAKQSGIDANGDGENVGVVKQLLSRWREKVFVLLLQQRLQQMEDSRNNDEKKKERVLLLDQIETLGREKEMLSHALTDRTAELELQASKTLDIEGELSDASTANEQLEAQLCAQQENVYRIKTAVHEMADKFSSHQATFGQALTKIANVEQRLAFVTGRMGSLTATLNCKLAMLQSRIGPLPHTSESGCQTDDLEHATTSQAQDRDLSSFSRERLEQEVISLAQERDSLVAQLRESTESFQQQIRHLNDTSTSRLAVMEGCLGDARRVNTSMEERLSLLQSQHTVIQEEKGSLCETVNELQSQLRETHASFETRVETVIREQKQKSISDLAEMEKLVNVARREHAKAVVQLQQLQRRLARDRDHAVEAVELGKAKLEHELECCRRKLQATQVERNLLMTTLRQDGIVIPVKQPAMKRASEPPRTVVEESGQLETDKSTSLESIQSDSSSLPDEKVGSTSEQFGNQSETLLLSAHPPLPTTVQTDYPLTVGGPEGGVSQCLEGTDIREVLRDLQMLSASLLGMETDQTCIVNQQSTN